MGSKSPVILKKVTVSEEWKSVEAEESARCFRFNGRSSEPMAVVCEESEEDAMYGEGVVNRAATGVVALMVFLILGLLAIVFAILIPLH